MCKWGTCGKGFARQHDCKRHEALHLNIRPFTCEGCSKTFARMDALNRHRESITSSSSLRHASKHRDLKINQKEVSNVGTLQHPTMRSTTIN